jgi:hypothetical protein
MIREPETVAVLTLPDSGAWPVRSNEILHVRELAPV